MQKVEEYLDDIDKNDTGNLEISTRLVFIDEKCGNLIAVSDGGEFIKNTNQKKTSDVLQ